MVFLIKKTEPKKPTNPDIYIYNDRDTSFIYTHIHRQARSQKCIPGGARPHTILKLKCNEYKLV